MKPVTMKHERPAEPFLGETAAVLDPALVREVKGWVGLAVAALAAAGFLALLAVMARTPGLRDLLPWPWQEIFPKVVITHVDLSIILWFLSVLGAMVVLATARTTRGKLRQRSLGGAGLGMTVMGSVLLVAPALFNWGEASLNNYVPVLIHPVFYAGLVGIAVGVATVILRLLLNLPGNRIGPFEHGVAATGVTFLVALACFGLAWAALPPGTDPALANERLFWGGGHLLQFVNTMLMLVAWQILAEQAVGVVPSRLFVAAMWVLAAAAWPGIALYGAFDVLGREHREAFTQLLWYGLLLPPAVMMVETVVNLIRARQRLAWGETPGLALLLSLVLFSAGGGLGYFLGVGDTRTPSHYHAVIGGVNLAVMGLVFTLFLPLLQKQRPTARTTRWPLLLYGGGQLAFSLGLFAAGLMGVPRKTAGLDQGLDTTAKSLYMAVYGAGGMVAVVGGILFVWMAASRLLFRRGER
ncbi:MAG: Uncharacterized protein FD153_320 [Rhodospirillaceae bacterium]|nr:MAG: Uncharacterized protein FD153_320 [Rhodospirillaceae bacterium]